MSRFLARVRIILFWFYFTFFYFILLCFFSELWLSFAVGVGVDVAGVFVGVVVGDVVFVVVVVGVVGVVGVVAVVVVVGGGGGGGGGGGVRTFCFPLTLSPSATTLSSQSIPTSSSQRRR